MEEATPEETDEQKAARKQNEDVEKKRIAKLELAQRKQAFAEQQAEERKKAREQKRATLAATTFGVMDVDGKGYIDVYDYGYYRSLNYIEGGHLKRS